MPRQVIEPACLSDAKQNAIRELNPEHIRSIVDAAQSLGAYWWEKCDTDTEPLLPSGYYPTVGKARIGQQRFREEMLIRFDSSCALSGPLPGAR